MLGAEQQIIETYVNTGRVKIIFWPIVDFGPPSQNAHAAAFCAGQQSADLYWAMHDFLFENFSSLRQADSAWFSEAASGLGADAETFASCYDRGDGHFIATDLDGARKRQGVVNRPTFEIDGQRFFGNQPFEAFMQVISAALP